MAMNWTVKVRPEIWVDPRLDMLARRSHNKREAVGKLIEFWSMAQSHWVVGQLIPIDKFNFLESPELVECGFAEIVPGDGVRAKGDCEAFAWLKAQKDRSQKGVDARRQKANSKSTPSQPDGQPQVNRTVTQELEQELELELRTKNRIAFINKRPANAVAGAFLSNSPEKIFFNPDSEIPETDDESFRKFLAENTPEPTVYFKPENIDANAPEMVEGHRECGDGQTPAEVAENSVKSDITEQYAKRSKPRKSGHKVVTESDSAIEARKATRDAYVEAFKSRYHADPLISKTENSLIKKLVETVGQEDAPHLVRFYLECQDDWLVNNAHPLGALVKSVNAYIVRRKKGQVTSRSSGYRPRPDARRLPQIESPNRWEYNLITNDDFPDDETTETTTEAANV